MKWLLVIMMIAFTYSDARPVQEQSPQNIARPLEDLVPMLDDVTEKLTDLSKKIESL